MIWMAVVIVVTLVLIGAFVGILLVMFTSQGQERTPWD